MLKIVERTVEKMDCERHLYLRMRYLECCCHSSREVLTTKTRAKVNLTVKQLVLVTHQQLYSHDYFDR